MRTDAAPLIEAKQEYIGQLQGMLSRKVYGVFFDIFLQTVNNEDVELVFETFQKKMEDIREWNTQKVMDSARVVVPEADEEFFSQLVTTVLILKTKIMTSFKIDNLANHVHLKVPSTEHFMHRLFIILGNHFYNNPFVFLVDKNKRINTERYLTTLDMIHTAIDETITFFVPVKNILREYLGVQGPQGVDAPTAAAAPAIPPSIASPPPLAYPPEEVRSVQGVPHVPAPAPEPRMVPSPLLPPVSQPLPLENIPRVEESEVFSEKRQEEEEEEENEGSVLKYRRDEPQHALRRDFDSNGRRPVAQPATFESDDESGSEYDYEPEEDDVQNTSVRR